MNTIQQTLTAFSDQCRCQNCPPGRVCAWDCEQGMNWVDIIIGMALDLHFDAGEAVDTIVLFQLYNGDDHTWQTTR